MAVLEPLDNSWMVVMCVLLHCGNGIFLSAFI